MLAALPELRAAAGMVRTRTVTENATRTRGQEEIQPGTLKDAR